MNARRNPLLMMACLLLCGGSSLAACKRDYPVELHTLGYTSFIAADGKPAGIVVDVLQELSRRSGCRFLITADIPLARSKALAGVAYPWYLVWVAMREGKISQYQLPMMSQTLDLLIHAKHPARTLDDLRRDPKVVFAVVRAATYGAWADQFLRELPTSRVEQTDTAEQVIRKVAAGRVAATFGNPVVYLKLQDALPGEGMLYIVPQPQAGRLVSGLSFNPEQMDSADLTVLQQHGEAMRKDGSMLRILSRYLGPALAEQSIWQPAKVQP